MAKDSFGIGDSVTIKLDEAFERLEQSPLHQLKEYTTDVYGVVGVFDNPTYYTITLYKNDKPYQSFADEFNTLSELYEFARINNIKMR
jgi:hypothetical protein